MSSAEQQKPTFTHLFHHHSLEITNGLTNRLITCSGCSLPILGSGGDYYTCRRCSFSLHSSCFKLPPTLHHTCHPAHELQLSYCSNAAVQCQACSHPIAPDGGSGFSYKCQFCPVQFHSLCLFRPVSIPQHPYHPMHELYLKFSSPYGASLGFHCDVCGHPGQPKQWLYRCNHCNFDIHVECSTVTSVAATTRTRSAPTTGTLSGPQSQPPPPAGYPPIPPTSHGAAYQGPTNVQFQQALPTTGTGMNQTQQQSGPAYQQLANTGFGTNQGSYQVINGGYSTQTIGAVPVTPGMGMGSMMMAGVFTGVGEGIGQGLVQSTTSAFGFGGQDSSGFSDQNFI